MPAVVADRTARTVTALTFENGHAHRDHDRRRHVTGVTVAARALGQRGRTSDGWPALAHMEKIMSNTKRTEGREVCESGELTDDNLAVVVGGSKADLKEAKACFKEGDVAGGRAAMAAYRAGGGGPGGGFYP
jgi:hypothetical protein